MNIRLSKKKKKIQPPIVPPTLAHFISTGFIRNEKRQSISIKLFSQNEKIRNMHNYLKP